MSTNAAAQTGKAGLPDATRAARPRLPYKVAHTRSEFSPLHRFQVFGEWGADCYVLAENHAQAIAFARANNGPDFANAALAKVTP